MYRGRYLSRRSILLSAMGLLLSCAFPLPGYAEKELDAKAIEHRAISSMQSIIEGIIEGDYHKYVKDFSDTMRKATDREKFLQMQSNLRRKVGKFKSFKYIGFYVQEGFVITLFKARFSKEKDDVLVNLVLDRQTEPKVTGLWFDAPSLRTK